MLKRVTLNLFIHNCCECGGVNKVHQAKFSKLCIDCLNEKITTKDYMKYKIYPELVGMTSSRVKVIINKMDKW